MALISKFERTNQERMSLHQEIDARISTYELDGRKLVQIDTMGRSTRQIPGKVSQSIQLDENGARELVAILSNHFGL